MNKIIRNINISDYSNFIKLIKTNITFKEFSDFLKSTLSEKHIIIVILIEDKIIGTGTLIIEPKLTYNISHMGHIENILVDEEYRCKGIGKSIINYLSNYAKEYGCYRIDLTCEEKLEDFYKNLGFEIKQLGMTMLIKENFK